MAAGADPTASVVDPPGWGKRGGPADNAGMPLAPPRSIAVNHTPRRYGPPIRFGAHLPWIGEAGPQPIRRLMVARGTGSDVTGEARADLFFGSGEEVSPRVEGFRHGPAAVVRRPRLPGP